MTNLDISFSIAFARIEKQKQIFFNIYKIKNYDDSIIKTFDHVILKFFENENFKYKLNTSN